MGRPAARMNDYHNCPMVTGTVPHVGGNVAGPGVATVLIGGQPAATMGDMCICTGPPDTIIMGSSGVFIGGKPAARMGEQCAHGGVIMTGMATVLIGETGGGADLEVLKAAIRDLAQTDRVKAAQVLALKEAAKSGVPFCEQCEKNK